MRESTNTTDRQMEKTYLSIIYISYIFLYFFFCSLIKTLEKVLSMVKVLLLEKVLSMVATKNKQNILPSWKTKRTGERLTAGYLFSRYMEEF